MSQASLNAIPVPPDAVLPQAGPSTLGLVLLDTRFPRPVGDAGNPASWSAPVRTHVVAKAWPDQVVTGAAALRASPLLPAFTAAVRVLEAQGVGAITTSCGFLVLLQQELQAAVRVPVVTSSLLQLPGLLPSEEQVGVLTFSARHLSHAHLLAAGVPASRVGAIAVQGMPEDSAFVRAILGNHDHLDLERTRAEVVACASALHSRVPALRTLVLECTNMPPHAAAIAAATGLRVLSVFDDPRLAPYFGTPIT